MIVLAAVLGVLLVAGVIALRVYGGAAPSGDNNRHNNNHGPIAVSAVSAPKAGSPECAKLARKLPKSMPSGKQRITRRSLAKPAPKATAAWAATGDPTILRCGLQKPAKLKPTSELSMVSKVQWLQVKGHGRSTYYAVDRAVYVSLTVPDSAGTGPLQDISKTIRATLPQRPVHP